MTHSTDEFVLQLPAGPEATRLARTELDGRLPELDGDTVDDVMLIVSELINNAVQHGEPAIELHVQWQPLAVDVSVLDHGPTLPSTRVQAADVTATSGRGLAIIDSLAQEWGVVPLPDGRGKTVWATLRADGHAETIGAT